MLRLTDVSTAPLGDLPEETIAAYLEAKMDHATPPSFAQLRRDGNTVTLSPLDGAGLTRAVEAWLAGSDARDDGLDRGKGVLAVVPALRAGETLSVPLPDARPVAPGPDTPAEIGLIDAGIAFWNPGFQEMTIRSVGHLASGRANGIEEIGAADIDAAIARGGTAEGDRRNRALLAAAFPGSVHVDRPGQTPLVRPGRPAHGTAMLDALGRRAPSATRIHALELPRSVLRDSTGIRMRTVLPLALAAVAGMAARKADSDAPLRLVVLLSYGFPGGPQNGEDPAFLRAVTEMIDALAARNIALELVLPTGNHLQGQGIAHLPAPDEGTRPPLVWRVLPADHSSNRLELFHDPGIPELSMTAPDGSMVTRAEGDSFALIRHGDHIVGLIYTQPISDTQSRTEIILAPSAARHGRPGAPFGAWTVTLSGTGEARAYIRRDDSGFEDDRAAPFRRSWLEDPAYRASNALGLPGVDDADHPQSIVRRAGSISVLCTGSDSRLRSVGARWSGGGKTHPSIYGGLPADPADTPDAHIAVDGPGPYVGMPLRADGSDRLFRLRGTSIAAALHAGSRAAPQAPASASE